MIVGWDQRRLLRVRKRSLRSKRSTDPVSSGFRDRFAGPLSRGVRKSGPGKRSIFSRIFDRGTAGTAGTAFYHHRVAQVENAGPDAIGHGQRDPARLQAIEQRRSIHQKTLGQTRNGGGKHDAIDAIDAIRRNNFRWNRLRCVDLASISASISGWSRRSTQDRRTFDAIPRDCVDCAVCVGLSPASLATAASIAM